MAAEFTPFTLLGSAAAPASGPWTPMPYADVARFDAGTVRARWTRLHAGQRLPPPAAGPLADGWALYHTGEFERAAAMGHQHGDAGLTLLNQATAVYATYLEPREAVRLTLFRQVVERAAARAMLQPDDCHALYWQAYALARYSHGISVARALAQGLGSKIKSALERVIDIEPRHADAHIALAAFHTDVIDKVGALVGRMTYGARAEAAIELYERGLELNPDSPAALMEFARGLLVLNGSNCMDEATHLYERAAELEPADARERLDVELARAGLQD